MTYVGHYDGEIRFVGSARPDSANLDVIKLPDSLAELSFDEVLRDYRVKDDALVPIAREHDHVRVAVVSVYDVACGIATYAHSLVAALRELTAEVHVFAEHEDERPNEEFVTRCWRRGESVGELIAAIKAYSPDLIIIQHEYGNFPVARHWLSLMGALSDYHVIVTLHSVYKHRDKTIVEAACRDIVVHTEGARNILVNEKQIGGRVTTIPHGCPPVNKEEPLWNLYGSKHTIVQFGFGFAYKGWENSVETVAGLRTRYPDVFLTGLISERWPGVHAKDTSALQRLVRSLGVTENVGLVRGFQSEPVLDSYLRTNRVGLFPYRPQGEHTVYACSGAARAAMAAGLPIVTSTVPLFEDLRGIVPQCEDAAGWIEAISNIFENGGNVAKQNAFLSNNSWPITARRYLELY